MSKRPQESGSGGSSGGRQAGPTRPPTRRPHLLHARQAQDLAKGEEAGLRRALANQVHQGEAPRVLGEQQERLHLGVVVRHRDKG